MNPTSPYIFTAPVEAYTYYISHESSPGEIGYVTQAVGIHENSESAATLLPDKNTVSRSR